MIEILIQLTVLVLAVIGLVHIPIAYNNSKKKNVNHTYIHYVYDNKK